MAHLELEMGASFFSMKSWGKKGSVFFYLFSSTDFILPRRKLHAKKRSVFKGKMFRGKRALLLRGSVIFAIQNKILNFKSFLLSYLELLEKMLIPG